MKISEFSVKRPVTVLMMIFIILILGTISFTRIPLDMMPELEIPVAVVNTNYQGVGPQEMEKLITQPIEEAVGSVENIDTLNSISSEGSSLVIIQFDFGVDMNEATLDIREQVDMVEGFLPDGASEPMVLKFNPDSMPIMMLSMQSESMDLTELQDLAENIVKPRLERSAGVASADLIGGLEDIVEIRASSEKLNGYGISLDYIGNILRAENTNLPGGSVQKGSQELTVKTSGEFESVEEIQQLLIPLPNGTTVPLNDIAEVELKTAEPSTISKANGNRSIDINIMKQSGTNTVKVSQATVKEIEALERELEGTEVEVIYSLADYIEQSLNRVYTNGIMGGILAVLVLYLFLRNIRTTFIIGAAIPISIIATFSLLYFSDITLNMMTLGGLALGIGMLVDNSVVVLENIYRFRQDGYSRPESAIKGSSEVITALVASTMTTLAVFLPIVFVQGLTSTIFKQLALTVSFSLAASLLVAVTLVPMLSSKILKVDKKRALNGFESVVGAEGGQREENNYKKGFLRSLRLFDKLYNKFDEGFEKLKEGYGVLLKASLRRRRRVVVIATLCFFLCISSGAVVGTEFFPSTDEGYVIVNVSLPDGSELENTMAIMDEIEARVEGIPEIETVFLEGGYGGGMGGLNSSGHRGTVYVILTPLMERERGVEEISDQIRELTRDIPGAEIHVAPMELSMGGGGDPVSISIYGEDLETLRQIGSDFVGIIENVEGTTEVSSSYEDGIPEVVVNVDRQTAAQYGLTASQIAQAVRGSISGTTATTYKYSGTEIDVIIKGDEHFNQNMVEMEQIPISTNQGFAVSLGQVADIELKQGPVSINRTDQERVITVSSKLSGRDMGSVAADINAALADYQMPDRYYYNFGGEQQDMAEAFSDLYLALGLAIVLVYMVMASQFESLLYPFIIMFAMPLGFAGGIFGLFLFGYPVSVPSLIGLIMLAGIVVNNAIVLVDYINTRRRIYGEDRNEAIINAGSIRLRPILMTALTTVLAMVPLSLGIGEGAELSAPMAIVVVSGLTLSTLVTLVVIPVMYTLLDDLSNKFWGKTKGRKNKKKVISSGSTVSGK